MGLVPSSVLLLICGCASDAHKSEEFITTDTPVDNASIQVQTLLITKQPFMFLVEGSGELKATQQVEVPFQVQGFITKLRIGNSQWVKSGTLLAKLHDEEAQLALQKAQTELKERQVEYESQLIGFQSARQDSSYTTIQENVRYGSGLAAAQLAVEEAKMQLRHTYVTAPISGIIANLSTEEKQQVEANQALCTIYAPGLLVLEMQVLEGDIGQVTVRQPAEVRPVALPGKTFPAQVTEINPMVDENSMVKVKLQLLETEELLPGMRATATIRIPTDSSLVVPKEAVVIRSGKAVVFTEEEGLAKWNYVTTGLDNGEVVQIIEGLEPDKQVIIDNNLQLAHDTPVQARSVTSSAE